MGYAVEDSIDSLQFGVAVSFTKMTFKVTSGAALTLLFYQKRALCMEPRQTIQCVLPAEYEGKEATYFFRLAEKFGFGAGRSYLIWTYQRCWDTILPPGEKGMRVFLSSGLCWTGSLLTSGKKSRS